MIRDYKATDLEEVLAVFHRSVREVNSRDCSLVQIAAWTPEPIDRSAWASRLASGGVFVCEHDKVIIGFARINEEGYVDLLYVHSDFQGQGAARALLKRVVSWAVSRGIQQLTSEVSITAQPFFEHMGFRTVKEQEVERRRVKFKNYHMELSIQNHNSPNRSTDEP